MDLNIDKSVSENLLKEIVRQSEIRLQAQLQAALAADQRALSLAGGLGVMVTVLVAGSVAAFGSGTLNSDVGWVGIGAAVGLIIALCIAVWASRPVKFDFPGSQPSDWQQELSEGTSVKDGLADMAAHYDDMIAENNRQMSRAGWWLRASIFVSILSLSLGVIFAAIAHGTST